MPSITITGMSCQHCVASATKALQAIDGIDTVSVSLEEKKATYTEKKPVDVETIKKAIKAIGFDAA